MVQDSINLLLFIVGGFSFILALTQLNRFNSARNVLFFFFFVCISLVFFIPAVLNSDFKTYFYFLMGIDIAALVLGGTLLYIYFRDLHEKSLVLTRKDAIHLIPVAITLMGLLPAFFFSKEEKLRLLEQNYYLVMDKIFPWITLTSAILIVYFTRLIMLYFSQIKQTQKNVYFNILMFSVFCLLDTFIGIFAYLFHSIELSQVFYVCTAFIIFWLYFSSQKYQLILQTYYKDGILIKSKRPLIEHAALENVLDHIQTFLKEQKIHTNPELSLYSLAAQLSISPQQLSYIINEKFGKNFKTYINEYRIEESKKLLLENTYLSLEGIGQKSGFGSHTAFLNAFKNHTNMTPGQYRKKAFREKFNEKLTENDPLQETPFEN